MKALVVVSLYLCVACKPMHRSYDRQEESSLSFLPAKVISKAVKGIAKMVSGGGNSTDLFVKHFEKIKGLTDAQIVAIKNTSRQQREELIIRDWDYLIKKWEADNPEPKLPEWAKTEAEQEMWEQDLRGIEQDRWETQRDTWVKEHKAIHIETINLTEKLLAKWRIKHKLSNHEVQQIMDIDSDDYLEIHESIVQLSNSEVKALRKLNSDNIKELLQTVTNMQQ